MPGVDWIERRIYEGRQVIAAIVNAEAVGFQDLTPSQLPDRRGIYVITHKETGEVLRAGMTERQTLRDRVYHDHLMSSTSGNLPAQLVTSGTCRNRDEAKQWIREHCAVQFLEEQQLSINIKWAEHFLLAVLRPKFGGAKGA